MKSQDIRKIIEKSALFNESLYAKNYPDVPLTKMDPLMHFIKYGMLLNRNPSCDFDSNWYSNFYHDVKSADVNPFLHFLTNGKKEGRKTKRTGDPFPNYDLTPRKRYPMRYLKNWDENREEYFLKCMTPIIDAEKNLIDQILVSIVMPSYNRAEIITDAIRSVQEQEHANFELLIIDDGSTDNTKEIIKELSEKDPRINYIHGMHQGVSSARNIGLENASGDYIFYLDTDNTWLPNHLSVMLTFMEKFDVTATYSGSICMPEAGREHYRGDDFNWNRCHELNYLDMNAFAHKTSALELCGNFDENLKRLVDWDFILGMTRVVKTVFLPFLSVRYSDDNQFSRITNTIAIQGELPHLENRVRNKYPRIHSVDSVDEIRYPLIESFFQKGQKQRIKFQEKKLVASNASVFPNLQNYQELALQAGHRAKNLISIVVVCFNKSELTKACIESIFRFPATNNIEIEVIVVDNGSSDDTGDVIRKLVEQFPNIVYVHNDVNMMFSMGNNIGAAKSSGEYIVFLNNDTIVTDGWLDRLYQKMDNDDEIGMVGPKLLYPDDDTVQCAGIVFNEHSSMPYHIYRGFPRTEKCVNKGRQYQALTGACMMMRAKEFFEIHGFDPDFVNGCEDIDLCLKLTTKTKKKIFYVPESEIYHYEGKTEGRGKNIAYNRELLLLRWGRIRADDKAYYLEDGIEPVAYEKKGAEEHGALAAYSPVLRAHASEVTNIESSGKHESKTLNIGFVSIWHVRGISIHTLQLAKALECNEIKTHIFARWESDRFSNKHPVHHPRVLNAGDDPSGDEFVKWCFDNEISTVVFMETHPKDWKRVEKAKQAGIKVICYENLDILRRELIDSYEVFDGFLFNTFFTRDVMLGYFPDKPSITIPWGIELPQHPPSQRELKDRPLNFIHIAGWGGVNNRKNTGLLIEAFDAAGPIDGELFLYSQSPISAYGESVDKICKKNDRIHVHEGTVEDIGAVYNGKDILLWPSKREGVGLPILEALINGMPVLISDGYMMKQWIKPDIHGVICPAKPVIGQMYLPEMEVDRGELAVLIKNLTEDKNMVSRLSENVAINRSAWEWGWQKGVLKKMFLRFSTKPSDPIFHTLDYLPAPTIEFENERRLLNSEKPLK